MTFSGFPNGKKNENFGETWKKMEDKLGTHVGPAGSGQWPI